MASPGKWEIVNKKNKKATLTRNEKKSARKALSENMPRIDPVPPLKPSETLFELGFEKIGKKQNKEQVPPTSSPENQQLRSFSGGKMVKKSSGDAGLKHKRFPSLETAVKALDLKELQEQLDKSQNLFPGNPSVWVKDLAGYLNYKLQAPDTDPTLSQYSFDYPYSLANKELRNVIKSLLGKTSDHLEHFFDHCIYTMLREQDKAAGESLHGYRICIQAMLLDKPKIGTTNLGKYLELLRSQYNKPNKCLSIMWALGQTGTDLAEGLKVWLNIMLPVLGVKSLSGYAISYLDRLLMMHSNLSKGFGTIGPKDFFPLLDFAYMPNNSLSPNLQDQLRHLYPRLKVLAFGAKPDSILHTYFPSFLSRATPNCPPEMKKELLKCMVECLTTDSNSFSVWRQLYTKHLSQSSLLLNNLLEIWDSLPAKVQKALQETIRSFKVTNEELTGKSVANSQEVQVCNTACNNLLQKLKGGGFPWLRLLLVLTIFAAGFVVHDIRTHGSFNASSSAHVLQQSGIMSVSQQAWIKISHYSKQGYSWIETNTPYYYSEAVTMFGPSLELVWRRLFEIMMYTKDTLSNHVAWIVENLPRFTEWIRSSLPDVMLQFVEYAKELLLFVLQNYIFPALEYIKMVIKEWWKQLVSSCEGEISWDCVKTHFMNIIHLTWSYLQNTTTTIKNWTSSMISNH
ncbi:transmembrane protein 214 [Chiloscyllium plagiosum]|uniref:transmembrane protein 214 n=1 Tax=Chiloscyllium plagiosum TaxID=36176 RepID=UPI001CB83142|nr:transmembrane protein 214 [Chiloscyllium plagiosum]